MVSLHTEAGEGYASHTFNPSVDWAMAEALAFGTLALHREVQPESLVLPQTEDPTNEAIRGLNKGESTISLD